MSIVQLKSKNKDLSFIIKKNPHSGLLSKSLKKGTIFGFYTKGREDSYNVYFRDGSDEVSFPAYEGETFEYLNTSRYNSATFIVNAIDSVFRSAFKSDEYETEEGIKKDTGGEESTFFINMIYIRNERYIAAFEDYFPGYKVDAEVISGKNYRVTITTKKSIYELLNIASLFGIFQAIVNDEPMFVDDELAMKYINCMNVIDAPYFPRYLFKIRFLRNYKIFKKVKDELSKSRKYDLEMTLGDTWSARQMSIENRLSFNNPILDVGCGEGKYITRFNRYMKGLDYYAVDIDPVERAKAEKRVSMRKMKDVHFFNTVDEFLESKFNNKDKKVDVICTEVIEHMQPNQAEDLMSDILESNVGTLIVTTPDVRFNQHYVMEGMRHDDHDFEWDNEQFTQFMETCLNSSGKKYTSEWFGIGDVVDGVSPSQGIIVKFQ